MDAVTQEPGCVTSCPTATLKRGAGDVERQSPKRQKHAHDVAQQPPKQEDEPNVSNNVTESGRAAADPYVTVFSDTVVPDGFAQKQRAATITAHVLKLREPLRMTIYPIYDQTSGKRSGETILNYKGHCSTCKK